MNDYKKYRWFYTSSEKLVVGGKSDVSNDELLKKITNSDKERVVMHTSHPGSPFCVIITDEKISKSDREECAIFCGCFSRAWKEGKRKTEVHEFKSSQLHKESKMKAGTWGVLGKVIDWKVELELKLVKQKRVYRAVPFGDGIIIKPGKIDKAKMIDKLKEVLNDDKAKVDDLLSALPAGGIRIIE